MITANNMVPVGFVLGEPFIESALNTALANATRKYATTATTDPQDYELAPIVITDAILTTNCGEGGACDVPKVIKNTRIQMNEACNICITDLSLGERTVYGIDSNDPMPTPALDSAKSREQALQLAYSAMKTYWLGNKSYVAGDLKNAVLLPAYIKDDGQWKKILAENPTRVNITQNAGATAVAQKVTYDQALAYIDEMIDKQSISLQMIMNSEKVLATTNEIFDAIQSKRIQNDLAGIRFVEVANEFGNFDSFVYRDVQVIKYEHFSAAINDLTAPAGTKNIPNRMILTVGLPRLSFPIAGASTFKTFYNDATRKYTAATLTTILQPEAVAGDYYVVAY